MSDLPRDELMDHASNAILKAGGFGKAAVQFKYTCEQCGERCVLRELNNLYESGECNVCGHITKIEKGGYMLILGNIDKLHRIVEGLSDKSN